MKIAKITILHLPAAGRLSVTVFLVTENGSLELASSPAAGSLVEDGESVNSFISIHSCERSAREDMKRPGTKPFHSSPLSSRSPMISLWDQACLIGEAVGPKDDHGHGC